jgi:hypothetical protein
VEIRQFTGEGRSILVPRLYGQNEASRQRKGAPKQTRSWDEAAYFELLRSSDSRLEAPVRRIYDWAIARGVTPTWGSGAAVGSMTPRVGGVRSGPRVVTVYSDGSLELAFIHLKAPFDDPERKKQLLARFAELKGFALPANAADTRPNLPGMLLLDDAVLSGFLDVLEWWATETEAALANHA